MQYLIVTYNEKESEKSCVCVCVCVCVCNNVYMAFTRGTVVRRICLPMQETGDAGLIPWLGSSPGGGNGNQFQFSCLRKIPCTEEPEGLQSMGSQGVKRN